MEEIKADKPVFNKKPNLFFRLLAFLLTLLLVLGAVAAVAYRDQFNLDALRRYFTYRSLARSESGQAESFAYEGGTKNSFATLDGGLLVCSPTGIRLYSNNGTLYLDKPIALTHPVVDSAAKAALVYDAGGQSLFVFSKQEEVFSLTLEGNHTILSASLNKAGFLAVNAQEHGYKGAVTVYDAAFQPVLKVNLSSSFVTGAVVSPDSRWLAIATAGLGTSGFESRINLYQLDRSVEDTEPEFSCSVGNNVCLDLRWDSYGIWALGENALSHVQEDGTLSGSYSYAGRYLKNFSLDGDDSAALLLGKYRAGSSAELVITDAKGAAQATLALSDQVLSLSAAGRYIAVLTADRLNIYTQELELYDTLLTTQGARRVIQRVDGSAMLIGAETARLYLPQ